MTAASRIYVDFDDVLCETAQSLVSLLERRHRRTVAIEDIRSFDLGESFGLSAGELTAFMELAHEPDVLLAIPPVPGAVTVMRDWNARGYPVDIVTGRPPSAYAASREWLARLGVPYASLVFVDKYGRGHAEHPGVPIVPVDDLARRGLRLAIDDSPVAIRFLARHLDIPVVVFDRPWNRELPGIGAEHEQRLVRCRGWSEINDRFEALCSPAQQARAAQASSGGSRRPA
jgi:5'(3')-deoxyribonucleotidase